MKEWKIIHEADDEETGKPSMWSLEIMSKEYGKFVWITLDSKEKYNVEAQLDGPDSEYTVLKSFRSLKSAKQWVERTIA